MPAQAAPTPPSLEALLKEASAHMAERRFADAEAGMSFAYTMNRMGGTLALTDRCQLLVDAAYRVAGYRSDAPGCWVR